MILLDTHIWIWWVHGDPRLSRRHQERIQEAEGDVIGISVISCWEVAKLVERHRLVFDIPVREWLDLALSYPAVSLLSLTPEIAVESTELPGEFHRDPADQMLVATARIHGIPILTDDGKILRYSFVDSI